MSCRQSLYSTTAPPRTSPQVRQADANYDDPDSEGHAIEQQQQHSASPFPSAYVDPTAITKRESSSDDDMLYLYPQPAAATTSTSTAECYSQATDTQPSDSSHNPNASWASDSTATVDVDGAFDVVSQATFSADDGGGGYGFNTYDSVEFQTLKEHSLQPSISDQYLRL
jgi:hypothetical protein